MSDTNETRADIIAEMRDKAAEVDGKLVAGAAAWFRDFADRIEAAAARERNRQYEPKCDWSVKDALALANTLANHGLRDGNADAASSCIYSLCRILSAPGNAAAMREALHTLREAARNFYHEILNSPHSGILDKYTCEKQGFPSVLDLNYAIPAANIALSAPARNCDRYRDEDDAFAAWHDSLNDGDTVCVRNAFAWLFAKAEGDRA